MEDYKSVHDDIKWMNEMLDGVKAIHPHSQFRSDEISILIRLMDMSLKLNNGLIKILELKDFQHIQTLRREMIQNELNTNAELFQNVKKIFGG